MRETVQEGKMSALLSTNADAVHKIIFAKPLQLYVM